MNTVKHDHSHISAASTLRFKLPSADTLGILASIACLIHCLAVPLILLAVPAVARNFTHDDCTHYVLAGFVVAFCLFAVVPGYLRHNRKPVLITMLCGVSLVLFATFCVQAVFGELWEMPLITVGNLMVVAAHASNRKLLACRH